MNGLNILRRTVSGESFSTFLLLAKFAKHFCSSLNIFMYNGIGETDENGF